jgi:hypothetical protein
MSLSQASSTRWTLNAVADSSSAGGHFDYSAVPENP